MNTKIQQPNFKSEGDALLAQLAEAMRMPFSDEKIKLVMTINDQIKELYRAWSETQ